MRRIFSQVLSIFIAFSVAIHVIAAEPPSFVVRSEGHRARLDFDLLQDSVVLDPAWNGTQSVYGRIMLAGTAGSLPPRAVVGLEAGDLFGVAACSLGDLDGDGIDDIAVAVPGADAKTDSTWGLRSTLPSSAHGDLYGRICLISGATGSGLGVLHAVPQEMAGWGVARVVDMDRDGLDDVLVRSFVAVSPYSTDVGIARYAVVSSSSGTTLDLGLESDLVSSLGIRDLIKFWNAKDLRQIRIGLAADLNADGEVDALDLVEQLANVGQTGDEVDRGDLDIDEVIDGADVAITIYSIGQSAATNASNPRPEQFSPCKMNPEANCFLCPEGGSCDSGVTPNPGDIGDGGGGDPPGACPGCPPPCSTCCATCPCPTCPPGGCVPPDVNCNGQPDPPECAEFYKLDARTDSNNDNVINESDDTDEDGGRGRVLVVHSATLDAPRDVATINLVKTPPSISRWRVDAAGLVLVQPAGATPIESGVWYQTSLPTSFKVEATLPGAARFGVSVDTGGPCGRLSDSVDLFCVAVAFRIDNETQSHQRFLAVLPGDASMIDVENGLPATHPVFRYTLTLPEGRFVDEDDELVPDIASAAATDTLAVYAPANSDGYLEMRRGSTTGQLLARKPVRVGGSIKIGYDRVPTFKVSVSEGGGDGPIQHPSAGGVSAMPGGITMGGGPIYLNGRNMVRPGLIDAANDAPQPPAKFNVRVLDADEQPLGKRKVRFIPKHGMLRKASSGGAGTQEAPPSGEANMMGFTADTNSDGVATLDLFGDDAKVRTNPLANFPNLPWQERGVAVERVGVLVGRSAKTENLPSEAQRAQYFATATLALRNLAFTSGAGFSMDIPAKASGPDAEKHLFHLFEVPLASHTQLTILKHWLEGPIIFSSDVPGSVVAPLWLYNDDGILPENPEFEEMNHVGLFTALSPQQRLQIFQGQLIGTSDIPWLNAGTLPSTNEMLSVMASIGAGVGEIAWGFVPIAPDLLDFGKEVFWQPVINEQNPDYWVVAFSAFGLLSDAGYIALPAGAVGNAAAAVGKFIARLEKRFPGLVRGIVTGAGSVAASARAIADYAKRIPAPPGGDTIDHATEMVLVMVRQSVRVLTLPGVAVDRAVEAITLVWRRAGSAWGDEAVEGIALVCKRCFPNPTAAGGGCDWLPEHIINVYGDDIAKKVMEITRKLPLDHPSMTAEAIEGVAVALKAVGSTNSNIVREMVEGTAFTAASLGKTLENMKRLDGVDGLNDMVVFLRNNRNNANGIDGAIFESTVAKRITDGELPGSGGLTRVSADGLPDLNRIDTTTSNWAIQVKHQRDSGNMGVGSFGSSDALPQSAWPPGWTLEANGPYRGWMQYLDQMIVQAGSGRDACVILNRQPTADLLSELSSRGILFHVVSD